MIRWIIHITALWLLFLLNACGSVKPVTITETKVVTDTVHHDRIIYVADNTSARENTRETTTESVKITVNDRGDTLRTDTRIAYIRDRELERENTRLLATIDSLQQRSAKVEYKEVPVEVDKPLTAWQTFRLRAFWWLLAALAAVAAWHLRPSLWKLIKRL